MSGMEDSNRSAELKVMNNGKARNLKGKHVIVSMGENGILWTGPSFVLNNQNNKRFLMDYDIKYSKHEGNINIMHFKPIAINDNKIISSNGAGDCFCAGMIYSFLNNDRNANINLDGEDIIFGLKSALESLQSPTAVPFNFSFHSKTSN